LIPRTLIPAGTEIPCERIVINDLMPNRDGQSVIELPICVGNSDKMLFNMKINAPDNNGFMKTDQISVAIGINADKLLVISASCHGIQVRPELMNPFANKELSGEERAIIKAEREVERSASANGGIPSKQSLDDLIKAYKTAGNDFQAAETAEMKNDFYPNSHNLNDIGIMYSNSGNREKAIKAYEKAIERDPNNATLYNNLALEYKWKDKQKYKECVKKAYELNPESPIYTYEYGRVKSSEGDKEEALRLFKEAYDKYLWKWNSNNMQSWDYSWFSSVAESVGEYEMAKKVRKAEPKQKRSTIYDVENLSKSKDNQLIKY
jgi:tetratricopeptide (TPR) repeat protein